MLILVVTFAGILESIGVGLFIPLLNVGNVASGNMDGFSKVLVGMLSIMGVDYNLNSLLVLMLIVFFVKGFASLGQATISGHITASLTYDLRRRFISLMSQTSYRNFSNLHTGFLNNIVTTESDRAVASFGHYANTIVSAIYVIAYAFLALIIDVRGTIIFLVFGFIVVFSLSALHRLSRQYSRLTTNSNASLQDILIQTIQAFKYLRATDRFGTLITKVSQDVADLAKYVFRLAVLTATLKSLREPIGALVIASLIFLNVSIFGDPLADVLVLGLVIYRLTTKLLGVQENWQKFNSTVGGLEAYRDTFDQLESDIEQAGGEIVTEFSDKIELQNVNFSYGDRKVLDSVSIKIPRHSMVGIVGQTGAGKSTIINLLTGVLNPDDGLVLIDGLSIGSLDKPSLRSMIGYVTQENVIFRDTIANNVSLWEVSDKDYEGLERVRAAVREVHGEDFVEATEDGYHTVLGDRGLRISGGQRQQIAIAREVFRDPEIVVLDEAMSALDAKSEWLIHRQLNDWRGKRTMVVVTHRIASVKDCDYVYVLSDGRVIEEGTFQDLYGTADSSFAELARLQGL